MSLNFSQKKAVETTEGKVLVLAGAGSGKTRVITERIIHLIKNKNISPSSILGLTFTNKAANEMQERVSQSIGKEKAKKILLSTFHSFCVKILRHEIHHLGFSKNFTIYDEKDIERLLLQLSKEILNMEKDLPPLKDVFQRVLSAKTKNLKESEIPKFNMKWQDHLTSNLYQRMSSSLQAYNACDFDSLLSLTVQLFQKFPHVLEKYQNQFIYIMIDEYQDTNPVQYKIAKLLSEKHKNLFVVGDDDQAIYSWRGAEIEHILNFQYDHLIKLEQNYRSTPIILQAANAVIKKNKKRHNKTLFSKKLPTEKISIFHAPTEQDEAKAIADRLVYYKNKGYSWKEMAVLYRSNALSRHIESALIQASWKNKDQWMRSIPYEVIGGMEFTEKREIKDLCAYLRVIVNEKDEEALLRIINIPRRKISDQTLLHLKKYQKNQKIHLYKALLQISKKPYEEIKEEIPIQQISYKNICHLINLFEEAKIKMQKKPYSPSLEWFIKEINYQKAIEEEIKNEKARLIKWENVQQYIQSLKFFEEEKEHSLEDFIASYSLSKERSKKNLDQVKLMTIHSAKGLEFPICFIASLEDHILPHEKSLQESGLEEERRLFYVAITRAKEKLTLSMSRSRKKGNKQHPSSPSRFLSEIPSSLLEPVSYKFFG